MSKSFKIKLINSDSVFFELISNFINFDGILSLSGDLASGKTTLAKAIIKALCSQEASSPTYLKMSEHTGQASAEFSAYCTANNHLLNSNYHIYHYDFYAANSQDLIFNLFEPGLHIIEWLDEATKAKILAYGLAYRQITITPKDDFRLYELS